MEVPTFRNVEKNLNELIIYVIPRIQKNFHKRERKKLYVKIKKIKIKLA